MSIEIDGEDFLLQCYNFLVFPSGSMPCHTELGNLVIFRKNGLKLSPRHDQKHNIFQIRDQIYNNASRILMNHCYIFMLKN